MDRRAMLFGSAMMAASLALTGCTVGSGGDNPGSSEASSPSPTVQRAPVIFLPAPPIVEIGDNPLVLPLEGEGRVTSAVMTDSTGKKLEGQLTVFPMSISVNTVDLDYDTVYRITAKVVSPSGTAVNDLPTVEIRTQAPKNLTIPTMISSPDIATGSLLRIHWDEDIIDRTKAESISHVMNLKTGSPVEGSWRWRTARDMEFRPASFWPAQSQFQINVAAEKINFGDGLIGQQSLESIFRTGDDWKVYIDDAGKWMNVHRNGEMLRSIPVSNGKPNFETPNGIYVIGDKNPSMIMDSATYNGPEQYRLEVQWATQLSWSGIYVHSAPWSVAEQGNTNTSHGCPNVTPEAAEWFQKTVPVGTPVIVSNSSGPTLPVWDGLGYWNGTPEEFSATTGT